MLALCLSALLSSKTLQPRPIPPIDWNDLPYQETVRRMAQGWRAKYGLPGVWCAFIKDGRVVACVADGYRNLETKAPADVRDHLNVGSVSKVITGTLIAQFVARGVIQYDTKIGDVFPELAKKYPYTPFARATLAQLMSHTSGLPSGDEPSPLPTLSGGIAWRSGAVETAFDDKRVAVPGTRSLYANAGPFIAVAMVERALGGKYAYEQWITGPEGKAIGLTDPRSLTWTRPPAPDEVFPHYIDEQGYVRVNADAMRGRSDTSRVYAPQGSCSVTLTDLCAFVIATMSNAPLLSPAVDRAVRTRVAESLNSDTAASWSKAGAGYLFHDGNTARGEFATIRFSSDGLRAFVLYTNANYRESDGGSNGGGPSGAIKTIKPEVQAFVNHRP